jgi:hypothetical protein
MVRQVDDSVFPLTVVGKSGSELQANKEEEMLSFGKLKIPPQMKGYIKCPQYDFY